jgi:hypothetical protein
MSEHGSSGGAMALVQRLLCVVVDYNPSDWALSTSIDVFVGDTFLLSLYEISMILLAHLPLQDWHL